MKIDSISNQNFKAFEFSERATELLQRRYKNPLKGAIHEQLVRGQSHSPVSVHFDTNKKGNALIATVSVLTDKYEYLQSFKEGLLSRHLSPLTFVTKMNEIANKVIIKLDNINAAEINKSDKPFKF